jgi:type IV secretory pathway component VirB8
VGRQYTNLFEGENALDKLYGKQTRMTVEIVTAVPDGKGAATVRYILTKARAEDPSSGKSSYHTATLAYEYLKPSKLTVKERQLNPLGFQVTSYRSDEDFTAPAHTSAPKATWEDSE